MPPHRPSSRHLDRTVLLFLLGLFLFASPFRDWWMALQGSWYTPYAFWAALIALTAWLQIRRGRDGA